MPVCDRPVCDRRNRTLAGIVGLAAIVCGTAVADESQDSVLDPSRGVRFDQKLDAQLPLELVFQDENGRPFRLRESFDGKPVVLLLVYYMCPMLCGVELEALTRTLQEMEFSAGDEFNIVTVSFDSRETPDLAREKRKKYLKRYGRDAAETGWRFLTGDKEPIRRLTQSVGFQFRYDERNDQFAHAAGIIVVTPEGRVSRYLYGVEYPARDLRLALVEASRNRIGSAADRLLLLCYHYDPAQGKYGVAIFNILRAAGAVTVAALAGLIFVLIRVERSKSRQVEESTQLSA